MCNYRSTARNGNGVVDCSPKGTDNLHIVADTESRKNIHPIMSKVKFPNI